MNYENEVTFVLELKGNYNIFSLPKQGEAVCITTNGIVKQNGCAVMGKGIALQADNLFHVSGKLGQYLQTYGNRPFNLGVATLNGIPFYLFSFPTKHHWKEDSDITLICDSAQKIVEMCDKFNVQKCYLPLVGCGCGNLNWDNTVKPWLSQILDNRFIVVLGGKQS